MITEFKNILNEIESLIQTKEEERNFDGLPLSQRLLKSGALLMRSSYRNRLQVKCLTVLKKCITDMLDQQNNHQKIKKLDIIIKLSNGEYEKEGFHVGSYATKGGINYTPPLNTGFLWNDRTTHIFQSARSAANTYIKKLQNPIEIPMNELT